MATTKIDDDPIRERYADLVELHHAYLAALAPLFSEWDSLEDETAFRDLFRSGA